MQLKVTAGFIIAGPHIERPSLYLGGGNSQGSNRAIMYHRARSIRAQLYKRNNRATYAYVDIRMFKSR